MKHSFVPLKGKPKEHAIYSFDTEGNGEIGGFVCGAIVGDGTYSFYENPSDMFYRIKELGCNGAWIFAHNAEYDLPVLEGDSFGNGEYTFLRYGLYKAEYEFWERKVVIYDSMNLFPRHSVADLGEIVGLPKLETPDHIMRQLSQGRPYSWFLPNDQELIRKYCMRDAEIVYLAVRQFQDLLLSLGGELKPTISGCSMDLYRRKFHFWPWYSLGKETNDLARPGYYGGRVENFRLGKVENVNMYDVTSLYPSVQSITSFPHPNHTQVILTPGPKSDWLQWAGVAQVEIEAPNGFIPLLPYRYENRLFFPTGNINAVYSIVEIRRALEAGYILKSVDWVLGSKVTFNPFEKFIHTLFDLRMGYLINNDHKANLVKLLLNSLYGRFGLNVDNSMRKLIRLEEDTNIEDYPGYSSVVYNGALFLSVPVESKWYPNYINVLFAAQIAAEGRIVLYNELERQGESSIYCDTDSIITTGRIETGEGLGTWRLQMENGMADLLGPKEYALHNLVTDPRFVAKGIPERYAEEYMKMGHVRFQRALSIREAITQGKRPSTWVEVFKSHQQVFPKRFVYPDAIQSQGEYWQTWPYETNEIGQVTVGVRLPPDFDPFYPFPERPLVKQPVQSPLL